MERNREPMDKNRIEGAAEQGERANDREALVVETAAHLVDDVFPRLPVRQWVLAVPKRLRYFLQRDVNVRCPPVNRL